MLRGKAAGLWSSYLDEQYLNEFAAKPPREFRDLALEFADIVHTER